MVGGGDQDRTSISKRRKMPQNSKNSKNSQHDGSATVNPFALLSEESQPADEEYTDTVVVAEPTPESRSGRPLRPSRKRQQHTSPPSPPPAPKRRAPKQYEVGDPVLEALARVEATLARVEERAIRAEKRVEELECTVKDLLQQQHTTPPRTVSPPPPTPPLHAEAPPFRLPGVNLDISGAPRLRDLAPGQLRERVDECLHAHGLGFQCLGVNVKEKDKIRAFFKGTDYPAAQGAVDKWVHAMAKGEGQVRIYGEQWFPVRVDRVKKSISMDELGCKVVGLLNKVKITKMRWLSRPAVEKAHGSIVIFLEEKEQADKLLSSVVNMPGGEIAFPRAFLTKVVPTRCFRCHEYGHTQLRCPNPPVCGQCAATGHQADTCTSIVTRCAACRGPHRATDPGCTKFRKERKRLQPSP